MGAQVPTFVWGPSIGGDLVLCLGRQKILNFEKYRSKNVRLIKPLHFRLLVQLSAFNVRTNRNEITGNFQRNNYCKFRIIHTTQEPVYEQWETLKTFRPKLIFY